MTWEEQGHRDYMQEMDMLAAIQRMSDLARREYWSGFRTGFFLALFGALFGLILAGGI